MATAVLATGCAAERAPVSRPASSPSPGACPTAPVDVVVSVDQWGDIVSELGGACAAVTTVLASSSIDPHDYEPAPADAASFSGAQLIVVNGADYDHWATDLAATAAPAAPVVSAAAVTGTAAAGYQRAAAAEAEPSPGDVAAFHNALAANQIDVLVYNTQTEGSIPEQIRAVAEQSGVPVVEVTETVPPGEQSFVAWQDGQLTALAEALGVRS
ncbi:MAG: hypothetical protein EBU54_02335 [Mycobacteriaceae bacterium]|nr:hypothetical protein [Mycobacteriaceae bacterium]